MLLRGTEYSVRGVWSLMHACGGWYWSLLTVSLIFASLTHLALCREGA